VEIAPQNTQKRIAWTIALLAALGLVIGLLQAPVGQWSGWEVLDGAILVILAAGGVYYGVRGGIYTSKMDLRRQRSWAWTGVVLLSILMLIVILLDVSTWSVLDTFAVFTWIILLVLFVPQIIFISRALAK
jgi:hypothetical protein